MALWRLWLVGLLRVWQLAGGRGYSEGQGGDHGLQVPELPAGEALGSVPRWLSLLPDARLSLHWASCEPALPEAPFHRTHLSGQLNPLLHVQNHPALLLEYLPTPPPFPQSGHVCVTLENILDLAGPWFPQGTD